MSEPALRFGSRIIALGYDLPRRIGAWSALRPAMARGVPDEMTRDEWAYLLAFLAPENLEALFVDTFGERAFGATSAIVRPRGPIAVWLPSNVSLLGPLMMIACTFAGAPVRIKAGSRSSDLCGPFLRFARENLPPCELRRHLEERVTVEAFGRDDPRNLEMAAGARVRIAFGSDAAVDAIHRLPHPPGSVGSSFGDHRSEAWVEPEALDDDAVATLVRAFSIYGSAGCTSPRRVVVIDGDDASCRALRSRMVAAWPRRTVAMRVASANCLASQLAAADGWDVVTVPGQTAVVGVGDLSAPPLGGPMSLAIHHASPDQAAAALPANIQTVGHRLVDPTSRRWLDLVARTRILRWVPLRAMHHFGAVWDGRAFFRDLFEEVVVSA